MQTTRSASPDAPELGRGDRTHRCHECGEPIRGIDATDGCHRLTGCGHVVDGRFVRSPARADSTLVGVRIE